MSTPIYNCNHPGCQDQDRGFLFPFIAGALVATPFILLSKNNNPTPYPYPVPQPYPMPYTSYPYPYAYPTYQYQYQYPYAAPYQMPR